MKGSKKHRRQPTEREATGGRGNNPSGDGEKLKFMHNTIKKAARYSAEHTWLVLSVALVLTLLSIWGISKLPVYTARQALLPKKTAVAQRLQKFMDKFGSASDLIVVLENAPQAEMESFATDLAGELRVQPEISQVSERLDLDFFLKNAFLMIPADQMKQLSKVMDFFKKRKVPPEWPGLKKGVGQRRKMVAESAAAFGYRYQY